MSRKLTRTDCIKIAEQFCRSGFKGLSKSRVGNVENRQTSPQSFLSNFVATAVDFAELTSLSEQERFLLRPATMQELRDADKLTDVMLISGLTKEQAKVIYLRSFHKLSWKTLAGIFNTDWVHIRRVYDDSMHLIFYKAQL